jgi:diguanylate cyclase (GGDEF)-like protein
LREKRADRSRGTARGRPWTGLLRWSIASKLVLLLLGATLLTSLVVTWASTHSIKSFLREETDQEIPAILAAVEERLEILYSQRRLDVETFAHNKKLADALERAARDPVAAREVNEHLAGLLDRYAQYVSIVVLDPSGRELARAGEEPALSREVAARLAVVSTSRVGPIMVLGGRRVQITSTEIPDRRDRALGTLHAVMPASGLDAVLQSDRLGPSGQVFLVDGESRYLTPARGTVPGQGFALPLPEIGQPAAVGEYRNAAGERVLGSRLRLRLGRFGWALVVEEGADDVFRPALMALGTVLAINLIAVVLFGGLAFWIARSIVRPIDALSRAARRIADGEAEEVIDPAAPQSEIGVLIQAFNRMNLRLRRQRVELGESREKIADANSRLRGQNEELQRVNEVLEQLSITDGLTRLHNHRFFQEQLTREIKRIGRSGGTLCLALIDIDNFKHLNDRFGHASGDQVLCEVASVMKRIVRESDVLARYGGEEFALIPGQTDLEGAVGLAEKIRVAVAETVTLVDDHGHESQTSVTVSIGVAQYQGDSRSLFNAADRALYRAKGAGKDCVVVEEPD